MQFKLKDVRLSFSQNLFTPGITAGGDANQKPAYSSTFLIPKDDPQLTELKNVIIAVAKEKWGAKFDGIVKQLKAQDRICLHDGDSVEYEGFEGNMFVRARSYIAPKVFDRDKTELSERSGRPYAGCYVNARIDIYAQDKAGTIGKRINASLKGVQFVRDGDAFVGSAPASADDFDDLDDLGTGEMPAGTTPAAGASEDALL